MIELIDNNLSGFGEATVISYYGKTLADFLSVLDKYKLLIESLSINFPEELWQTLYPTLKHHPFILCALDIAIHDLWAQKQQLPLYQVWNLNPINLPLSNFTIGINTIEKMVEQMLAFPYPIYKIKLGTKEDICYY